MPLPCPDDERLAAWLEGRLDPAERAAVEEHVVGCATCSEIVAQLAVGERTSQMPGVAKARGDTTIGRSDRGPPGERPPPDRGPLFTPVPLPQPEDRYELSTVLGSGGMGDVLKAYDRILNRWVALKLVRSSDAEIERRFLFEAQTQARLTHENICRVYDVGRLDGQAYIAMQLVRGPTLLEAAKDLTLRQKLDVMAQVADALHAAHEAGLVHRDVKPGNVLIELHERRYRAFVADFGLVRDREAPGSTAAGEILGTPQYMAPEQALGQLDRIDARTDVYALGLSLYEVLTGTAAYQGSNKWEVLHLAQRAEPARLRKADKTLPVDLEAVVSKCLERDPRRRYQTMAEVAEELRRAIEGEPTQARPIGALGMAWRRAQRYPAAAAAIVAASLAIVALATIALRTGLQARTRAEAAQRFGERVQAIENRLRYAQLLPAHDLTPVEERVKADLADIRREMAQLGSVARGPGEFALGRGHLALGESDDALAHLRRAWEAGQRTLDAALALARASNDVYRREWSRLGAIADKPAREARRKELAAKLRDPAVAALREAKGKGAALPPFAEALIAQTEERLDDALALAQKALADDPFLYDAQLLAAEIHELLGIQARAEGKDAEADRRFALALMQVREAADVGRSDVRVLGMACKLGEDRLVRVIDGKRADPQAVAKEALPACELAVRVAPRHVEPHLRLAGVHRMLAVDAERHGRDPGAEVEQAARAFQKALQLSDGKDAQASYGLGLSLRVLASWQRDHGEDAVPTLERAASALQAAHKAAPDRLPIRNALASVLIDAANLDQLRGRDPSAWFDRATPLLDEALAGNPRSFNLLSTRAKLSSVRAAWAEQRGDDPLPHYRATLAALDAAQALKDQALSHYNKAGIYAGIVERHLACGQDVRADAEAALQHARRALELDPKYVGARRVEAIVHRLLAVRATGAERSALIEKARTIQREVLRAEPSPKSWTELAECTLMEAHGALAAGKSVARLITAGEVEARNGLSALDDRAAIVLAELALVEAQSLLRARREAADALAKAAAAVKRALAVHPHRAQAREVLARVHLLRAEALASDGGPPGPELDEAERLANLALKGKRDLEAAQATLALARERRARLAER